MLQGLNIDIYLLNVCCFWTGRWSHTHIYRIVQNFWEPAAPRLCFSDTALFFSTELQVPRRARTPTQTVLFTAHMIKRPDLVMSGRVDIEERNKHRAEGAGQLRQLRHVQGGLGKIITALCQKNKNDSIVFSKCNSAILL